MDAGDPASCEAPQEASYNRVTAICMYPQGAPDTDQMLTTAEATSFASQFWDRKVHPTKALQHDLLATCIEVGLEKDVKHAQWHKYTRKRGHQTTYFIPHCRARRHICKAQFLHFKKFRIFVQSVAQGKVAAAFNTPLSPMKSPQKRSMDNARRDSAIKMKFRKSPHRGC